MSRTVLLLLLVTFLASVAVGAKNFNGLISSTKLTICESGTVDCRYGIVTLSGGAVEEEKQSIILKMIKKMMLTLKRFVFGSKQRYKVSKSVRKRSKVNSIHQEEKKSKKNRQKASAISNSKSFSVKASKLSRNQGLLRIQREMQSFLESPPPYCELINKRINKNNNNNSRKWLVRLTGPPDTIYAHENYTLSFTFPIDYPNKPPSVYFLSPVPKHKHVYTNGDICLNLLGKDWRPIITAETLAVSILSMLSSAKEKELPLDNAMHADQAPGRTQEYLYHDDKC